MGNSSVVALKWRALILLLTTVVSWSHAQETLPQQCTGEATLTVCNLAWKESCKIIKATSLPSCRSARDAIKITNLQSELISAQTSGASPDSIRALQTQVGKMQRVHPVLIFPGNILPLAAGVSRAEATEILADLDTNPFDESAQGKARELIRSCRLTKTPDQMFACSGFLVPDLVRANCIGNGPCLPLPWGASGVPSGLAVQWDWQNTSREYPDIDAAVYVRPWVAADATVKKCSIKATAKDGAQNAAVFSMCMATEMGGKHAKKAAKCYAAHADSPIRFSACLHDTRITTKTIKQAECLTQPEPRLPECAKVLKRDTIAIAKCASSATDPAVIAECVAKVPVQITVGAQCAIDFRGDTSGMANCLLGAARGKDDTLRIVQQCAGSVTEVSKADAGTSAQLLKCMAGASGFAQSAHTAAVKSRALVDCVADGATPLETRAQCLRNAGLPVPAEAQLLGCVANAKTGLDAAVCAGIKGASKLKAAQACIESAGDDSAKKAMCIGLQLSLPPQQARIVSCAANSSSAATAAICMAGDSLPPNVALAAKCAAESQGSPTGTALCMAGPNMNAELRIAAECLASTGGEPLSFAGCAGGRLTMKELQQCISGGFKAENGCFGENNEIVKYFDAQEKILRGVLKVAGLETAYNNLLSDLKSGRLGEGNDIRRALELVNRVALQEPAKAAAAIAKEVAVLGAQVEGGVAALSGEISKVAKQIAEAVQDALPKVPVPPPLVVKTDVPGVGPVVVEAGPTGVGVSVGDVGVTVNPIGGSIKVGNTRVCIPWC